MSKLFKSVQLNPQDKKEILHNIPIPSIKPDIEENIPEDQAAATEVKEQIVKDAQEIADRIIQEAKNQVKELEEKERNRIEEWWNKKREEDLQASKEAKLNGYQEGYKEGWNKAKENLENQYHDKFSEIQQIIEESYKIKEELIYESELKIIELSLAVAEKIIFKEIEFDPDIIKTMTKEALKNIKEFEKISIHVHPQHFAYLQSAREELMMELNGQIELSIFPDPALEFGGCVIKTSNGTLDAKIDTQLEEIKALLFDLLARGEN